jgi:rhodanese-related sulfurtransferase
MVEHSRAHQWLAVLAGALGALALAAGDPYPAGRRAAAEGDASYVTAIDVARWIRDPKRGLRLIDLRPESDFAAYHIPGAEHVPLAELSRREWSRDSIVVLYAEDDARATKASRVLRAGGVVTTHVLRGGLLAWVDGIVAPRLTALAPTAPPAEQVARREQLELSRYFGGTPVVSPGVTAPATARLPSRRSDAAAVARVIRRGC